MLLEAWFSQMVCPRQMSLSYPLIENNAKE